MVHDHHHPGGHDDAAGLTVGTHGMLVFGGDDKGTGFKSPVYLSHLPMFMAPHDFQVIVRVGGEAAGTYAQFVAHFGAFEIYTFEPDTFSIDELDPAGGGPARTTIRGSLFRGHFERAGSKIAEDVSFDVDQVIHYRRFSPKAGHDDRGQLRGLCFGGREGAFVAHMVSAPPDFDQIVAVELGSVNGVSDEELGAGVILEVPGRHDDVDSRLHETETVTTDVGTDATGEPGSIEVKVVKEVYFETGDLASAM